MKGFWFYMMGAIICSSCTDNKSDLMLYGAADEIFDYQGRWGIDSLNDRLMTWSGTSVEFEFKGKYLALLIEEKSAGVDDYGNPMLGRYSILKNGTVWKSFQTNEGPGKYEFVLDADDWCRIQLVRESEAMAGYSKFFGVESRDSLRKITHAYSGRLLFLGNSITTGYGILGEEPGCHFSPDTQQFTSGYAFQIAQLLNQRIDVVAWSGKGIQRNYDKTEVATLPDLYQMPFPYGPGRVEKYRTHPPDKVIIHLGTNDLAHELPEFHAFLAHFQNFLRIVSEKEVCNDFLLLAGPTLGSDANSFMEKIFEAMKKWEPDSGLTINYLTFENIEGARDGCDSHPNAQANHVMAFRLKDSFR